MTDALAREQRGALGQRILAHPHVVSRTGKTAKQPGTNKGKGAKCPSLLQRHLKQVSGSVAISLRHQDAGAALGEEGLEALGAHRSGQLQSPVDLLSRAVEVALINQDPAGSQSRHDFGSVVADALREFGGCKRVLQGTIELVHIDAHGCNHEAVRRLAVAQSTQRQSLLLKGLRALGVVQRQPVLFNAALVINEKYVGDNVWNRGLRMVGYSE